MSRRFIFGFAIDFVTGVRILTIRIVYVIVMFFLLNYTNKFKILQIFYCKLRLNSLNKFEIRKKKIRFPRLAVIKNVQSLLLQ